MEMDFVLFFYFKKAKVKVRHKIKSLGFRLSYVILLKGNNNTFSIFFN